MNTIVDLIFEIEKRPALYISKNYLSCLKAFLDGFSFGNSFASNKIYDFKILNNFQLWIEEKYRITSTQSWVDIIMFYSTDENDALYNFFDLFREFLEFHETKDDM